MFNLLNLKDTVSIDNSITSIQYHTYTPFTTTFNNNDEIRIVIQNQDLYVLPCDSELYIEGTIVREGEENQEAAQNAFPQFVNNWPAFLFSELRYELNGVEIERCKNVGITSTIKGLISHQESDKKKLEVAGWNIASNTQTVVNGSFCVSIPLKYFMGFFHDYKHIMINARHELIMIRSQNDTNIFHGPNNIARVNIQKLQWRIQHVHVSDQEKIKLLNYIDRKIDIPLHFRQYELIEHPALPQSNQNVWSVKTSTNMNKPRYIIFCLQTNKNNVMNSDMSHFDHCQITNLKVYLNAECYPYENLNIDFENHKYIHLYNMYVNFYESFYYQKDQNTCPMMGYADFRTIAPLFVFDLSRQNESLKNTIVDIKINMESRLNIPENTTAYCLIIHDSLYTYNPYTNIVNKAI